MDPMAPPKSMAWHWGRKSPSPWHGNEDVRPPMSPRFMAWKGRRTSRLSSHLPQGGWDVPPMESGLAKLINQYITPWYPWGDVPPMDPPIDLHFSYIVFY